MSEETVQLKFLQFKTISGKTIDLTPEEAKELYRQLDELFGGKDPVYIPPVVPDPYPVQPWQPSWPWYDPWKPYVTCQSASSTGNQDKEE